MCGQPLVDKAAIHRLQRHQAEMERELKAQAQAKAKELLGIERAQLEQQIRRESKRKELNLEHTITALMHQNDELKRRLERMNSNERSATQEIDIFSQLQITFPSDKIEKCGRGGDIIHIVRHEAGKTQRDAGIIVYECKDTLKWSNSFLTQIRKAGQVHKTPYLILVTQALPLKESLLCVKKDVIVVQPPNATHLARIVRRMVVDSFRAGRRAENQSAKTNCILEYLNSDDFRGTFGSVVSASETLHSLLHEEQRAHERTWTRREQMYADLARKTAAIDEGIHAILEAEDEGRQAKVLPFPQKRRQ
jgi:hypothetical protein